MIGPFTAMDKVFCQCPNVQEFRQQVGRWLEEIFEIPIQLNIENTVFNTNMDEFPYFMQNTLSIAVNGPIICQQFILKILKLIIISDFRYVTKDILKVDICF
jgi:hypothetical protein